MIEIGGNVCAPHGGFAFARGSFSHGEDVGQYVSIVNRRVARVEVRPAKADRFVYRTSEVRLGPLCISRIQSDPVELHRSVSCIEADNQAQYIIGFNLSGNTDVDHDHRRAAIRAGSLFLLDKAMPYHATFPDAADRVLISVPRRLLESRLIDPTRYLPVTPDTERGIGCLAREHLQFLIREGHQLGSANQTHAIEIWLDLIALAFKSGDGRDEDDLERNAGGGGHMLLSRVKAHLQCALEDPELTPAKAADTFGLSKRYLHKLFSNSGTTFGAWVREERLLRARSLLVDPRYAHLTVTEVAMRQGFNDIPHFSRQFRARFGMAPRDARANAARLLA
ncbi:helix-turn-helix domain-containing protein [Nitratireductor sp. CAU 1489]|uniref:Helix-turn-helix domain-containing protein n=1 Tax=Nitratireductor arenosus TaxID=2682096 RepID=A0A844QN19_9HYPH|nr:helix-turn-helix domain-containing protein [Nitratireductor arenosus]MVA99009.1 helix-turn-helix domain-containing protein [Nitratireductor arenosus]